MNDIYETPKAELVEEGLQPDDKRKRFYKISGIGLGTFFGSIVVGGYLLAQNYKQLGQHAEAKKSLIYSVLGLVAIFAVGWFVDMYVTIPDIVYSIAQVVIIIQIAKAHQGKALARHLASNGRFYSNWRAFGISLIFMAVLIAIIVAAIYGVAYLGY